METTFEDEAGTVVRRKTKWVERIGVVVGSVALIFSLVGPATASAAPSTGSSIPAGAADDMHPLDREIMKIWIGTLLGQGFQRLLNGDGGGQGSEVAGPSPCPYCGATFPNNDQGWIDRAKHMLQVEWWSLVDDIRRNSIGTGSAG